MGKPEKIRLGEILVQQGLLSQDQLSAALSDQKRSGRKLGRVFIDNGYLGEDQIGTALAQQLQVSFVDLRQFNVKPELAMRLPEALARRFRAIVLQEDAIAYGVGFADPTDLFAYDEIARHLKRDIRMVVVAESVLMQTIDRIYRRTEEISGLAQELEKSLGRPIHRGSPESPQDLASPRVRGVGQEALLFFIGERHRVPPECGQATPTARTTRSTR